MGVLALICIGLALLFIGLLLAVLIDGGEGEEPWL